jgi:hypothetical protein
MTCTHKSLLKQWPVASTPAYKDVKPVHMQVAPRSDGGNADDAKTLALAPNNLVSSSWHHLWMFTSNAAGRAAHGASALAQTALNCSATLANTLGLTGEV